MAKKHAHHGGAWKVAYADFVTAMMALFLVLWLTAQDTKIKEAVERAFRNPFMSLTKESTGLIPDNSKSSRGQGGKFDTAAANELEVAVLRKLQQELSKALHKEEEDEETVKFQLTPEGLRVNIFDRARKPVFEKDSATLTEFGSWVLSTLAWEIGRYKACNVELEGHTEHGPANLRPEYSQWELTADRANAGRRKLIDHGVKTAQIKKVAGYADTVPLPDVSPDDPLNRRITLLLRVKPETSKST